VVEQESVVLLEGPWAHRDIAANGARFHAAEFGRGPLVVLLHGFPEFWWAWRSQIVLLGEAGYRVVAPDLRGYGASDKPPRGYDVITLAEDVAGMVRALGERQAVVIGHGWGALLGWTLATRRRDMVRRLAVISMPHPLRLRSALLHDPGQLRASGYGLRFQLPRLPERWLTRNEAANVGHLLADWSASDWPDAQTASHYREAMCIPGVAHSVLEGYRWFFRSLPRPDGVRAARLLHSGVGAPTLQLHGALDRCMLPSTAKGSERYVRAAYEWRLLDGVGHFPHEEAPQQVNDLLLDWLGRKRPTPRGGRDRDARGRPRNARLRDATGRPLPRDTAGIPTMPDGPASPPVTALAEAEQLIASGQPFTAHEILEAVWKEAPAAERELWRGLAQVAVGLTHAQRGNSSGAAALLRRGSERIAEYAATTPGQPPYNLALEPLVTTARSLALRLETHGITGVAPSDLRLVLRQTSLGNTPLGNTPLGNTPLGNV
jgi:pimeloyl-ACP methyl ester carboxylesterase